MKKRIFYIIHLDKERILVLSIVSLSLLIASFTAGYKIGMDKKNQLENISLEFPKLQEKNLVDSSESVQYNEMELSPSTLQKKEQNNDINLEELKKSEKIQIKRIIENASEELINKENLSVKSDIPKIEKEANVYREPFKTKLINNKEAKKDEVVKDNPQYYIQIAAYKTLDDLLEVKSKLEKHGISSNYKKSKKYYILYKYAKTEEEAENMKEVLDSLNIKKIIIKKTK